MIDRPATATRERAKQFSDLPIQSTIIFALHNRFVLLQKRAKLLECRLEKECCIRFNNFQLASFDPFIKLVCATRGHTWRSWDGWPWSSTVNVECISKCVRFWRTQYPVKLVSSASSAIICLAAFLVQTVWSYAREKKFLIRRIKLDE